MYNILSSRTSHKDFFVLNWRDRWFHFVTYLFQKHLEGLRSAPVPRCPETYDEIPLVVQTAKHGPDTPHLPGLTLLTFTIDLNSDSRICQSVRPASSSKDVPALTKTHVDRFTHTPVNQAIRLDCITQEMLGWYHRVQGEVSAESLTAVSFALCKTRSLTSQSSRLHSIADLAH